MNDGARPPIRVLHLEDSPRDAEIVLDALEVDGLACDVLRVNRRADFETALADRPFDLALVDFNLPDLDGLTAIRLVRDRVPDLPVIVVSGTIDPVDAVRCLQEGATDYVIKDRLERLPSAVRRALEEAKQRRQREKAEAKLVESEERFRQLAEQGSEGFWFVALGPERILYVNPAVETIWGLSADALYRDSRRWLEVVHPDDRDRMRNAWEGWADDRTPQFQEECRVVRPDGSVRWVLNAGTRIRSDSGAIARLSGMLRDITERKALEAQFLHSQKMESVGQLASGIAHDFNNLLTVINGMSELALTQIRPDDPAHADVREILRAGERAAALTRQLLAFSRQQILEPRVLDLNQVAAGLQSLLRRLIGEDVELAVVLPPGVGDVKADSGQIEQVLTNLAVNARDAMPRGGRLTIETANVVVDEGYARRHGADVAPGPYTTVAVTDTGSGMDEATRARIFEPFFTTKGPGKGTGLGLSTAYGIVKQSRGFISVSSEVGHGTTFTIHLPQVTEAASAAAPASVETSTSGGGTILLVEDNDGLRRLATRLLEAAGYKVLGAGTGEHGLALLESYHEPVHLLLSDLVLPGLTGPQLADRIATARPDLKVLYMSGYTSDAIVQHGVPDAQVSFLNKPFTKETLLRKVREALESKARPV